MFTELQRYIESKLPAMIQNELKRWKNQWECVTSLSVIEDFSNEIIYRLWDVTLSHFKGYSSGWNNCSAKEAVSAIRSRGLKKESIEVKNGKFILVFPNAKYVLENCCGTIIASPQGSSPQPMRWISLRKNDFAEFIFVFDGCLTYVKEMISCALAGLMPQIQNQIQINVRIDALSERYLKGTGIGCAVLAFEENGCPRLKFTKDNVLPMLRITDPDEFETLFKRVPMLMKKRPMDKVKNKWFEDNVGTITACLDWNSIPKEDRWELMDYFIKDNSKTHSRLYDMDFDYTEDGLTRVHFCFKDLDWVHLLEDIKHIFPSLNAYYAVVLLCSIYTNDAEGRCFQIDDDDQYVKIVGRKNGNEEC